MFYEWLQWTVWPEGWKLSSGKTVQEAGKHPAVITTLSGSRASFVITVLADFEVVGENQLTLNCTSALTWHKHVIRSQGDGSECGRSEDAFEIRSLRTPGATLTLQTSLVTFSKSFPPPALRTNVFMSSHWTSISRSAQVLKSRQCYPEWVRPPAGRSTPQPGFAPSTPTGPCSSAHSLSSTRYQRLSWRNLQPEKNLNENITLSN